ncbi:hypothetical protein XF_2377 [Xylella fastidiosa 9a5c]|uniref:Uncharacterized protein n=1 Tax=Xylella fastidiosa (strain 9a5c) TaxID=160492 RepID=Q9PAW8_XYLFA|nr:hypothetical protein XF_2377 [Xylella fastidiosa 9a5c]
MMLIHVALKSCNAWPQREDAVYAWRDVYRNSSFLVSHVFNVPVTLSTALFQGVILGCR